MSDRSDRAGSPSRLSFARLLGAAVAFLGGTLLLGRYMGELRLVTVPGRFVAMQDNTAMGFVVAGLAVLSYDLGKRRLAFLCGALAAGLGSVVLAEWVAGKPFALLDMLLLRGQPDLRMAPATAIGFALAGALVLVHVLPGTRWHWRRAMSMAVSAAVLGLGLAGLLVHDQIGRLASLARMDVHSALAFLGLGVAFFLMVGKLRTASLRRRIPAWMPWLAGLGVGVLVLGIWVGLTADEERWRRLSGVRSHEAVVTHATGRLRDRMADFQRMALLLGRPDAVDTATALEIFLVDQPGALGAVSLDAELRPLVTEHVSGQAEAWADEILSLARLRNALERSLSDDSPTATEPLPGPDDTRLIYVCVPVEAPAGGAVRLVLELDAEPFFDEIFSDGASRRYEVEINDGNTFVYRSAALRDAAGQAQPFEHSVAFGDRLWTLRGAAWPLWMGGRRGASNTLILWIGVFLAFSIAFAVRKSEQLRQRADSLSDAKRTIEEHAAELARVNARLAERAETQRHTESQLRLAAKEKRRVLDSLSAVLIAVDGDGMVIEWNYVSSELFGLRGREALGQRFADLPLPWDREVVADAVQECLTGGCRVVRESLRVGSPGTDGRVVSFTLNPTQNGQRRGFALIGSDVTERQMLEVQLHAAQKLESVGTLAAGIAHEINTPMQFVGDNVRFVAGAMKPLSGLLALVPDLRAAALDSGQRDELAERLDELLADVDVEFVRDELPLALSETLDGIERVTTIVRAMKDFSHPGSAGVALADVNHAVLTTLSVARNEYKYMADVETDLGELPQVECWMADLNQVFLNLLVNGTHAIREKLGDGSGERGLLRVTTARVGEHVELRFSDSGTGIPEHARSHVFDQFFTTKEIGRGTGLGLSICRAVVVEKHGGTLDFETELGVGTTFIIRVPITQEAARPVVSDHAPAAR